MATNLLSVLVQVSSEGPANFGVTFDAASLAVSAFFGDDGAGLVTESARACR